MYICLVNYSTEEKNISNQNYNLVDIWLAVVLFVFVLKVSPGSIDGSEDVGRKRCSR